MRRPCAGCGETIPYVGRGAPPKWCVDCNPHRHRRANPGPRQGAGNVSKWNGEAVPPVLPKDPIVAERVKATWRMAADGMLLREIADVLGLRRSTVSAYLNDPDGSQLLARKARYAGVCEDCGGPTTGTANGRDRVPKVCKSCSHAREKSVPWRIEKGSHSLGVNHWSDEQIFAAIRSCIGDDGKATVNRYKKIYEQAPKGSMPSVPIILRRFDTWNAACEADEIPHGKARRANYTRQTRDDCLNAVVFAAQVIGRLPTYNEYVGIARDYGLPSGPLVRNRVGSWTVVLSELSTEAVAA
jgi:predicted transcriptional regulator